MTRKTDNQIILEYGGEKDIDNNIDEQVNDILLDNMNKTVIFFILLILLFAGIGLFIYNIYTYLGGL